VRIAKEDFMPGLRIQRRAAIVSFVACFALVCVALPTQAASRPHRASARVARQVRHAAPPPDSYLQYRVYTVDQLINQVETNATVRRRFARHFQIPESRVVSYMRANLVESYVPETKRYTVYCVRPSGRFYPIRQTFRRGTKVFALRNGEPVLKWLCGNPLSKMIPDVQTRIVRQTPPRIVLKPSIQELRPTETANVLIPNEVPTPMLQPAIPIQLASAATPLYGRGSSLLPFLLPIALLGVHTGGGHVTPAVPEPSSILYLAAGLPLAVWVIRRKRGAEAN
jgi:hypothetical protein